MASQFIVVVSESAPPPGPDDDPDEVDTPVSVTFPENIVERSYEAFCDTGSVFMTEAEAVELYQLLSGIIQPWPNGEKLGGK